MKPFPLSFNKLLLLTSMLFAPSVALAQEAAQPSAPPAAEGEQPADDGLVMEEGEIVVLGRNIPEPQRQTSEVASFLSAEDLARQGDDTAAAALTRVTGLSVVSGRFVYVRGLGDRYSSALLNGSPLPSPEPLRRTVPLDLFPSNILDGAAVQKTFSPNYPGEFGGGVIDLRTIDTPNKPFLTLKVGSSVNPETTARDGLFYYGSDTDWTGYDDGLRDIPDPLAAAIGQRLRIQNGNFTSAQLERIGESLVNSPLSVIQTGEISPDVEVEVSGGISFDRGRYNFGLIGVAGYDSSWRTERADRGFVASGFLIEDLDSVTTRWDITNNALVGASVGWDDHEIKLTGLYVHSTSKEAQISSGFDFNIDPTGVSTAFNESTGWYERELLNAQIVGEHEFGELELGWRGAVARSTRDAPYERSVSRQAGADGIPTYGIPNRNTTRFSELQDDVVSFGGDATYTLALSETRDAVFSGGFDYSNTVRNYELLQFVFGGIPNLSTSLDTAQARVDFLFSPDNISPQRFEIFEITGNNDTYKGGLRVTAGYLASDIEIIPLVRAALGVRYEESRQTVRSFNRFGEIAAAPVAIDSEYWLPAATLTWNFAENMQLRGGYSQTIARPQFRELAFSPYFDPDTDRIYRGNPGLVNSEFTNYDLRFEYYFGRNQFLTLGGFYKEIDKPIEEIVFETSTGNVSTNFINAPRATLYGAEFEYRTRFEMPYDLAFFEGKEWLFAINYTYTFSEIEAGGSDTVIEPLQQRVLPANVFGLSGKQLQGTPENIINLQFGYETDVSQLTLLVGWVDERVYQRGLGAGIPDIIENPGVQMDLVYRRDFEIGGQDLTLGLSGRNLLGEQQERFQQASFGRVDVNSFDRGTSFSISLTAKY